MKVLKMKKMSKGRYKITLSNGGSLILYEDVIIKNIVLTGKEIDDELLENISHDNYMATPYYQAVQYIGVRMRAKEELRQYLSKKEYEDNLISETIEKLEKEGYIDDAAFARAYISDRLSLSTDGVNKIRRALSNYKIREEIIEQSLANIDQAEISDKLDKLIAKQIKLSTKYTGNILKNRISNYLINLGYDSSLVLEKLNHETFKGNNNIEKEYQKLYKKYANKYSGYKLDMTIKQHLFQKGYDESQIASLIKNE